MPEVVETDATDATNATNAVTKVSMKEKMLRRLDNWVVGKGVCQNNKRKVSIFIAFLIVAVIVGILSVIGWALIAKTGFTSGMESRTDREVDPEVNTMLSKINMKVADLLRNRPASAGTAVSR